MMQLSSLWLSHFSVMMFCFAPLVLLHSYLVTRSISYRASIWLQKALLISLLLIPAVIFFTLSQSADVQERTFNIQHPPKVSSATHSYSLAGENAQALEAQIASSLSIADVWFPFVGLVFLGIFLGLLSFIFRILAQEFSLSRWQRGKFEETTGVRIFTSEEIKVPFSIGIWRKRIFLPKTLEGQELEIIRSHELNHCLLNHHSWSLLEAFQTHLFWFNPLAHILRKTGNLLREIECDEYSTERTDRITYAKILVETAERFAMSGMMPIRGQGWNHTGGLRMRLNNLLAKKTVQRVALWIASFVAMIAFSSVGTFYFATRIDAATEASLLESVRSQYGHIKQSGETVEIKRVPQYFLKALLLHEDQAFFEHSGVSFRAVVRATGKNLLSMLTGGSALVQGGSTLTQQLAKQFLSEKDRSIGRKFREYKLAHVLESNFSKDEILEMYLNIVYFGNQTTGLVQAAKYYYKTTYDRLSTEQSAMLIPFLDAPAKYNMVANPKVAEQRQSQMLEKLREQSN